jgi:lipopolysaccharide/colanic/teichoic acid biosynthesis glycosyltransferase
MRNRGTGLPRGYLRAKRALDVAGSALGLLLGSPLLLLSALAVRTTLGPPVLFRQLRPGRGGQPFELVKLRTMRIARPGEQGPQTDAARLTRLGRLLRATSLDELPTLLNVLRGEMSLVGPRPLLMQYLGRYSAEQARRHEVHPGITGLAQVLGRNALGWEERLALDVAYVEGRCLRLDLWILARTVVTVLRREGVSQPGHATMTEFRGSTP